MKHKFISTRAAKEFVKNSDKPCSRQHKTVTVHDSCNGNSHSITNPHLRIHDSVSRVQQYRVSSNRRLAIGAV